VAFGSYPASYESVAAQIKTIIAASNNNGPLFIRLAWHSAVTYNKTSNQYGSRYGSIGFSTELNYADNAGLAAAVTLLKPVLDTGKITCGDLYTFAGALAISEMQGPDIVWKPGRTCEDKPGPELNHPDPHVNLDATPTHNQTMAHARALFTRMGFTDREAVALIGAHGVGSCHPQVSGYVGPWVPQNNRFTNAFFTILVAQINDYAFSENTPGGGAGNGKFQYNVQLNVGGGGPPRTLMMLPADFGLFHDSSYVTYVNEFAGSQAVFFTAFSSAFQKLLENGVDFTNVTTSVTTSSAPRYAAAASIAIGAFALLL